MPNSPHPANKLINYENHGVNGIFYQALKSSAAVEPDNKIPISFAINGDNSKDSDSDLAGSSTHILYGYTDDKKWFGMATATVVNSKGNPIVLYNRDSGDKSTHWRMAVDKQ